MPTWKMEPLPSHQRRTLTESTVLAVLAILSHTCIFFMFLSPFNCSKPAGIIHRGQVISNSAKDSICEGSLAVAIECQEFIGSWLIETGALTLYNLNCMKFCQLGEHSFFSKCVLLCIAVVLQHVVSSFTSFNNSCCSVLAV